ncbi:A disintegrin and metalloproteinase with thrombospondin motifs 3-like [Dendronephthya gigantea]|uniref:A disintegrin and metalloproteinase with thrombospondin motifs 3-like n=1 Tax=Dendronephthya gigantea TaxID=151771 RepID=UPI00106D3E39|nr:A disintegrin and metalloproteinase with thrombospondin motifs 3-like [Dendronephthya gigantea]
MNCLTLLVLSVCVLFAVEGRSTFYKEEFPTRIRSLEERLLQDGIDQTHKRERRSEEKKAYVFFDNRSERSVQLLWRDINKPNEGWQMFKRLRPGSTVRVNTFENDEWMAEELATKRSTTINDENILRPKANTRSTRTVCIIKRPDQSKADIVIKKFVETFVVVDKSVRNMFENNDEVERYVKVLLGLATRVFQHSSVTRYELKIILVPSKIVFLEDEIRFDIANDEGNLNIACGRMNNIARNQRKRYDHKLFLTRNSFGAAGFARRGGMCSRSSCSIIKDHGFSSAMTIAHEVAHSLGASHVYFNQYSRYIMRPSINSWIHNHRWSLQSQSSLLSNTRNHYFCLDNQPQIRERGDELYHLPGKYFSFEKQCDLEYNKAYTAWKPTRWQRKDPCEELKCRMPGKYAYLTKTPNSPALDGTKCGENKWCMSGECHWKNSS